MTDAEPMSDLLGASPYDTVFRLDLSRVRQFTLRIPLPVAITECPPPACGRSTERLE